MSEGCLLTVRQVAERLGVRAETVRRWIAVGRIQGVMVGGKRAGYRITEGEVERVLHPERVG